ncbi:GNAT family N-acetyltransferase [Streptomyces sp. XH2]|uniref:GNAT family N-acetyltransferase n=1 Tax=Streptomyces sp. XH2 TaxID=3412483 RepID=UPI003C7D4C70
MPDTDTEPREAETADLEAIHGSLARSRRGFLPDAGEDVVRQLDERRAARRRGAAVHIVGSRAEDGEVASRADLYLDPASGVAQVEDLVTAADRLGRGHADAVLSTALRLASDAGCRTRFLTADAAGRPRHWCGAPRLRGDRPHARLRPGLKALLGLLR